MLMTVLKPLKILPQRFPNLSVLDRYVVGEVLLPFLFGMGMFTALMVAIGTGFDLVRKVTESGLLLGLALEIMLLRLPGFIVYAFPMSVLLAALMAYSRFSSDSELVALRSVGVSLYRIVLPGLVLSLAIAGVTFLVNDQIAPAANYQASLTEKQALGRVSPKFREENIIYPEYNEVEQEDGEERTVLTRLFYAEVFDGEQMENLTVLDRSRTGVNQVIAARSAVWNFEENTWDLFEGTIYILAADGSYRNIIRFDRQQIALPRAPLDLAKKSRDYGEMSLLQAQQYLEVLRYSGSERRIRKLQVRIQEKIAFPFICVVFGLIGSAIGLRPQNTNRATSFGICVGLVFAYYLLSFLASSLGVWGGVSPFIAAWLPNFMGLAAGSWLLWRAAR
ncbi:MAG: YjgP/YjgQ family permease [Chloroflexaceae bacterium]|nr:YjgP/YjgQ family permease [Chloroflexaceae bacterium]